MNAIEGAKGDIEWHGGNGRKGMGLVMIILVKFAP
jgi:hypothetical protein